jgi:hypothetical protein
MGVTSVMFEPTRSLLTSSSTGLERWLIAEERNAPGLLKIGRPQLIPPAGSNSMIATSEDGRVPAAAHYSGGLVLHQDRPAKPIRLSPHEDGRHIAASPDGIWIANGSFWGTKVKISEARTGKLPHELPVEVGSDVRLSPRGR